MRLDGVRSLVEFLIANRPLCRVLEPQLVPVDPLKLREQLLIGEVRQCLSGLEAIALRLFCAVVPAWLPMPSAFGKVDGLRLNVLLEPVVLGAVGESDLCSLPSTFTPWEAGKERLPLDPRFLQVILEIYVIWLLGLLGLRRRPSRSSRLRICSARLQNCQQEWTAPVLGRHIWLENDPLRRSDWQEPGLDRACPEECLRSQSRVWRST